MAHVAEWKKKELAELVELIRESPVIGVANVDGIPSAQMQMMRKNLRADATIKISKNTLLTLALKEAGRDKPGAEELSQKLNGSTALIATKMSPFKLYRTLEKAKTKAPARGGELAPEDIWVREGETQFKPGPIVGELQKAGIPAKIDGGKVVISKDKLLVKQGDKIPQETAQMLTRLEIFPLIVGMDLKAAYDKGTVYGTDSLSVDYVGQLQQAHREALALAVNAPIPAKGAMEFILASAYAKMLALASVASEKNAEAVDDDLKEKLANRTSAAAAAPAVAGEAKKEEVEEKGASEEEAMAGLGSLFG
ncbi:MAG: 50S ribosomal protein L10 [Thermoplasmatota archaeon]